MIESVLWFMIYKNCFIFIWCRRLHSSRNSCDLLIRTIQIDFLFSQKRKQINGYYFPDIFRPICSVYDFLNESLLAFLKSLKYFHWYIFLGLSHSLRIWGFDENFFNVDYQTKPRHYHMWYTHAHCIALYRNNVYDINKYNISNF